MSETPKTESFFEQGNWQKLSFLSILHFISASVSSLISQSWTMIPIVVVSYQNGFLWLAIIVILCLLLLIAILQYKAFSYRFDQDHIRVRSGVLQKKQLTLEYRRIQNINIERPLYFRIFGLATVKVDGAGSAQDEVSLAALKDNKAVQLQQAIEKWRSFESITTETESSVDEFDSDQDVINSRSLKDLVVHGATNFQSLILFGAGFAFLGQFSDYFVYVMETLESQFGWIGEMSEPIAILSIFGLVFIAISAMLLLSVAGSILMYWKFHLYRTASGYKAGYGLLNQRVVQMEKSRIQGLRLRQNWAKRIARRYDVLFQQVSHQALQLKDAIGKQLVIPAVTIDDSYALIKAYDSTIANLDELEFTEISVRYFIKYAVLTSVATILILALGLAYSAPSLWLISLLSTSPIVICLYYLRYKRWGVVVSGDNLIVRSGLIGVDYNIVPAYKFQKFYFSQSLLMRRANLATLTISFAGGYIQIPFLSEKFARQLNDYLIFEVEFKNRSWI